MDKLSIGAKLTNKKEWGSQSEKWTNTMKIIQTNNRQLEGHAVKERGSAKFYEYIMIS